MKNNYGKYGVTVRACWVGYILQAMICNFAPLLFVTFNENYKIPLSKITMLITVNFAVQLLVDALSSGFIEKIGYRASMLMAHTFTAAGFIMLAVLPDLFSDAFAGLVISVIVYAIGGGLIEVLLSPVTEACAMAAGANKERALQVLHTFFCWGHVAVVLLSTVFFHIFGIENWKVLALIWAAVPVINGITLIKAPMADYLKDGEKGLSAKELLKNKVFWVMMILMISSGASELAVSQWSSAFAEQGLKLSKTLGDLMGPTMFAIMMGVARIVHIKLGQRVSLKNALSFSAGLCVVSYLIISLSPYPALALVGCGLCGFSVGIMWPGTLSLASQKIPLGATRMFAYLALAGDIGCSLGPTVSGTVAEAAGNNLSLGILAAIIFPIILIAGIMLSSKAGSGAD